MVKYEITIVLCGEMKHFHYPEKTWTYGEADEILGREWRGGILQKYKQ